MSNATHQVPVTATKIRRLTTADLGIAVMGGLTVALALAYVVQALMAFLAPVQAAEGSGVCREYSNSWVVCAPATAPSGAPLVRMWEDGSAVYGDGTVFGGYGEE